MGKKNTKKTGFWPLLALVSWWKRRKFYVAQQNMLDDEASMLSERKNPIEEKKGITPPMMEQAITATHHGSVPQNCTSYPLTRNRTIDSFQDSIMSMDSLVESYWDPDLDDEMSQTATVLICNKAQDDFLKAHINFLSIQTQPREVEIVYDSF